MSGAVREKDAADYDLERFTEMFDQAMVSDDPRIKNALRQLMMLVILTDTEDHEGRARAKHGPLRRMQEDIREQWQYFRKLEQEIENLKKQIASTAGLGGYRRAEGWPKDYDPFYGTTQTASTGEIYQKALQSGVVLSSKEVNDLAIKINSGSLYPKEKK